MTGTLTVPPAKVGLMFLAFFLAIVAVPAAWWLSGKAAAAAYEFLNKDRDGDGK